MNSSQFKKLIVLLLIVGGIGFLFLSMDQKAWEQSESSLGGKVIPDFPLNDVASITLKDADNEIGVAKKDEIWTVTDRWDYPADFSKVGDLVQDVWDLKVTRNITAGPSQYGRLGLVSPGKGADSGILLTFKDANNGEVGSLLLGKEHMRKSEAPSQIGGGGEFPDGRYVLPNGNGDAIALVSETFSSVEVDAKYWLNKDFLKVEKLQSVKVTHPEATDSWSISRDSDTADMVLAGLAEGEELDSTKSYSLKNILSSPSFDDIADPSSSPEDLGLDSPISAELKTFDGFTYKVQLGKATDDDKYPISVTVSAEIASEREKPEDEKEEDTERLDKEFNDNKKKLEEKLEKEKAYEAWTYLVSKWTVDALLNKRADLIKQEEEDETSNEAASSIPSPAGPPAPVLPSLPTEINDVIPNVEEQIKEAVSNSGAQEVIDTVIEKADEVLEEAAEINVEDVIDAVTNPVPAPAE